MELHIKEKVRARRRLQHPCIGTSFETCETRVVNSGVFSTIKKIKSFLLAGKDKTVHYHRGQCYPRGRAGGELFAAKIKLHNLLQTAAWTQKTCNSNTSEGGVVGGDM